MVAEKRIVALPFLDAVKVTFSSDRFEDTASKYLPLASFLTLRVPVGSSSDPSSSIVTTGAAGVVFHVDVFVPVVSDFGLRGTHLKRVFIALTV